MAVGTTERLKHFMLHLGGKSLRLEVLFRRHQLTTEGVDGFVWDRFQFGPCPLPCYCLQAVAASLFLKTSLFILLASPVSALPLLHTTAANGTLADLIAAYEVFESGSVAGMY